MSKAIAQKDCPPIPQAFTDLLQLFANAVERVDAPKLDKDEGGRMKDEITAKETPAVLTER